ncbi:LINE-1 reverse transcriptase-like protein, partial [Smittium culicis]
AVTIPGYEVFHDCAREGANHGVILGIFKGHIAQRIPGIEDLLQTWSFDNLEEPCIISGDFNMSNSALGLLLKRHNTGYSVVDFSGSSKSFFGNGDKTWSSIDHIIVNEAAKGLFSNARVNRGYNISDQRQILGSVFSSRKQAHKNMINLEDTSTMEAEEIAATFVEASKKIAEDLTLYKASNRRPKRFYLTPSILKEIRAKDLAAAEWHKATEIEAKFLDKGVKIVAIQNGREHWKWVRRLLSESLYTKHKLRAARDETGNLLTSPEKVMQRWSEFYTALSSDSSGNSRNPDRWIEVLDNKKDSPLDINHHISWAEVRMVLMRLALYKAPGGDVLEVGWYKVLFNDYDVYCPESHMAKALLNLLQTIWTIPITKKGDLQLLDNYRGIALIQVGMKILGRIIIGIITSQLEARKKFSFLQAGFRRIEEAMAQVVSLYDILSRRRVAKKENFVAFIDFRKAYDTGREYEFFAAYYKSPEAGVRIGTLMSPLFKVDKGVRQGCPMSPMLFNIFINDILDKVNENIALVPGNSIKIPGLLFADDLVLLADSEVGLRENLLVVEKWANDNEMSFGISKCGALAVGGSFEHTNILELQGQRVPIVKEYWYLGVLINDELDLLKFCRHKVEKAEACYTNIRRLLSSKSVPMA